MLYRLLIMLIYYFYNRDAVHNLYKDVFFSKVNNLMKQKLSMKEKYQLYVIFIYRIQILQKNMREQ